MSSLSRAVADPSEESVGAGAVQLIELWPAPFLPGYHCGVAPVKVVLKPSDSPVNVTLRPLAVQASHAAQQSSVGRPPTFSGDAP
jgi:hypothetical protein